MGGDIRRVELLEYRDTVDDKKNLVLLDSSPTHTMVAQTGLKGASLPNHKSLFVAENREVKFADGSDVAVLTVDRRGAWRRRQSDQVADFSSRELRDRRSVYRRESWCSPRGTVGVLSAGTRRPVATRGVHVGTHFHGSSLIY